MAASDYDFILTRNELIEEAYRKIGALGDGQNISAGQLSTGNLKINSILKSWSGEGIHLWTVLTDTITTVAGTASYTVPTSNGLRYIDKAYLVDGANDVPIERMSLDEYEDIEDKASQGKPVNFSHRPAEGKVYLWQVPNQVWTIKLHGVRPLADWESSSSTGEFPASWQNALRYALAVDLGEDNTIPLKEIQYLRAVAVDEKRKARGKEIDRAEDPCVNGAY